MGLSTERFSHSWRYQEFADYAAIKYRRALLRAFPVILFVLGTTQVFFFNPKAMCLFSDKLDGLRTGAKRKRDWEAIASRMEDYLQLPDDYDTRASEPGKKRVINVILDLKFQRDSLQKHFTKQQLSNSIHLLGHCINFHCSLSFHFSYKTFSEVWSPVMGV